MATVKKQGSGYKITVSCGYNINDKQLRKHMTWSPTPGMTEKQIEKELARQATLFEEKCKTGKVLDSSIKFSDFSELWMEDYAKQQLKAKTISRYSSLLVRINAAIGHIRLDKLQPHQLMGLYSNLSEAGSRNDTKYSSKSDFSQLLSHLNETKLSISEKARVSVSVITSLIQGKNISLNSAVKICTALNKSIPDIFLLVQSQKSLSAKTVMHHHRLISSILTTAVQWQVIFSNPCDRVKPPKLTPTVPKYLDEVEAARLLSLLESEDIQNRTIINVLLFTGFRRGELCGLEWGDIDFENNIIHIQRTSLYLPEKGIYDDSAKNATSLRSIRVPSVCIEILKQFKAWQNIRILELGDVWHKSNRIFTAWDGRPIHPDSITGWFHNFVRKHNLPNINIHSLRHTNATLQIAGGVPLPTVANRLGHANASTTSKIYAHAIRSADEVATQILENILVPTQNNAKAK